MLFLHDCFPYKHVLNREKGKMARSSSCFRSLVLFLLEHFLLPLVEINFSVKYGLLKFKNCRASRSFVLYTPQKTLWHFFMFFFLLDSLCFITMCFPGTQLLTSYFENHVIIHVGQAGFIVAWAREFTKIITPWALTVTLRTLTWNYEIGKADRDCSFHKFWRRKFLGLCWKVKWTKFSQNVLTIFSPVIKFHWISSRASDNITENLGLTSPQFLTSLGRFT